MGLSGFGGWSHAAQPSEVVITSLDATPLKAWVFLPPEMPGSQRPKDHKRGTVVALHGCGGLYASSAARKDQFNARHQAMADLLVEQGYNVVFPDSLTPRRETSLCAQPIGSRDIKQRERRADALGTLAWIAQQPWADAGRVAVLGWSHGGTAVLAATDGSNKIVKNQPFTFKTALAFYPGCAESRKNDYRPNTPLTLFLGADDDWTPPIPCAELAQQLQADKLPVELNVYEGAVHDFDNPTGLVAERKNIPSRLHAGRGVMAGPNPAARQQAYSRMKDILRSALQ
jgi:dienelactone hydrolase